MLKIIQNASIMSPEPLGKKDVLIAADRIASVADSIPPLKEVPLETIDGSGKILVPGFIDSHVHILGGGGEGSYRTRTPEIVLSDITTAGVTTIVGCLGTDGVTRTMSNLVAKARGLEEEGITTFIYTGSYQVPVRTLTGSVLDDIILIDKVIGAGEIAMSDHRSSQPTVEEIAKIAAASRVGGLLSGKAGIINIHMGEGSRGLSFIKEIVKHTEIPITQFVPTHTGRCESLFEESIGYAKAGGIIDFTTSGIRQYGEKEVTSGDLLKSAIGAGVPVESITFSSDGQGSMPRFDDKGEFLGLGVGKVSSLFEAVRIAVQKNGIPLEQALKVITSNPARILKLEHKGRIEPGLDADLVLLDETDLRIDTVIARGQTMVQAGEVLVKGTFEE
jgi:beta-aspartyl-dipeptidase (metallo-type)